MAAPAPPEPDRKAAAGSGEEGCYGRKREVGEDEEKEGGGGGGWAMVG